MCMKRENVNLFKILLDVKKIPMFNFIRFQFYTKNVYATILNLDSNQRKLYV